MKENINPSNIENVEAVKDIVVIKDINGRKYTVRKDRRRYFFPDEWSRFIDTVNNEKHKLFYLTLLHTGARAMEALHLQPKNIDLERHTVKFEVVKTRTANKKLFSTGSSRTFFVSDKYIKIVKGYIRKNSMKPDEYFFLNNNKLPSNYYELNNKEKEKYFVGAKVNYSERLKKHLQKANVEDWYNFSLHNIRKTYGQWMRLFGIDIQEICYRLGHDFETFMSNYGSSLLFDEHDKIKIRNIMGNVK